jgi:hypothetical protein
VKRKAGPDSFERNPHILPLLDRDLAAHIRHQIRRDDFEFKTGAEAARFTGGGVEAGFTFFTSLTRDNCHAHYYPGSAAGSQGFTDSWRAKPAEAGFG